MLKLEEKLVLVLSLLTVLVTIYVNKFNNNLNSNACNINKELFNNYSYQTTYNRDINSIKLYINASYFSHSFSQKYNIREIKYNITFLDEHKKIINPIDLSFYYDLHIFCKIKSYTNISEVVSFPDFNDDKNLICIEYFHINEKIELGIKLYQNINNYKLIDEFFYYTNEENPNLINKNEIIFSPYLINKNYIDLVNEINKTNSELLLKSAYIKQPTFDLKTSKINPENQWLFKNIYNHYFCFCKGIKCLNKIKTYSFQKCKYDYYLNIIDNKRNLYEKTEYLLADFISSAYNSDDIFPIFTRLIEQNISAHYMTLNKYIYKKYCLYKNCQTIIKERYIDGDFLEKYLNLILRLKVTVAGADFPAINSLFYNIEYITSINIGHGVKYFKSFLYRDYTSPKKYNKLVLAPSTKLISVATKFGWKEENIIKICLPKWDKYSKNSQQLLIDVKKNKSIFFFFTWRDKKNDNNKYKISTFYINNIIKILNNTELNEILLNNNITLLLGLHPNLTWLKTLLQKKFNFIKFIRNDMISDCLMKANLMVTDFSSVIFDFIYQRKPVIIYIPDYEDPNITNIYSQDYLDLIKSLGNGTMYFENKFNNVIDVINKIIYYINNDFILESKINQFYDSFELKCKPNNIQNFINIIKQIN